MLMARGEYTASLSGAQVAREQPRRARPPKPPIAFRPLHRIWRRTLDEIDVARVRLPVRGLPAALEGMVACQLSDLHVDRDEDLERLVLAVGAVNAQQPDLVFLAGDYFTGPETMRRYLAGFPQAGRAPKPRLGGFARPRNYDHWV